MRKLMLVVGTVWLSTTLALAAGKINSEWTCAKPSVEHHLEAGDAPGHLFLIEQATCTANKGEIAGVGEKGGTATEFSEVEGNNIQGHGVFMESMANGDTITVTYQFTGTMSNGQMQSVSEKWQASGGTGKFKATKGTGTCTGTGAADGTSTWKCSGSYSAP